MLARSFSSFVYTRASIQESIVFGSCVNDYTTSLASCLTYCCVHTLSCL